MMADAHERFSALYEGFADPVYWFCRRRLGIHAGLAEDVVADVFTVVWRRIDAVPASPDDRVFVSRSPIASSATNSGRCGVDRVYSVASTQRPIARLPIRQQNKR